MKQITTLSDDAHQDVFVSLDDGTVVKFTFQYMPAIQRWALGFEYGAGAHLQSAQGMVLCLHPNLLRKFRSVLPFGLACVASDGVDPVMQKDFTNDRIQLYVLSEDEVVQVESEILTGDDE